MTQTPMLKIEDVGRLVQAAPRTIRRWVAEGSFPAPLRIGRRAVRWHPERIDLWLAKQDREAALRRR